MAEPVKTRGYLSEEQKVAANLFAVIFPHKLMTLQREIQAIDESLKFAKDVIELVREKF